MKNGQDNRAVQVGDEMIVQNHPHADRPNWWPGADDDDGLLPGDDAGWPPILSKETLDAVLPDPRFHIFVAVARVVVHARRAGAHIRALAPFVGESKSSLHRWLWLYEQIGTASLARTPVPTLSESEQEQLRLRVRALSQMGPNGDEKHNDLN